MVVACFTRFSPGWYFLYPLPFKSGGTWPAWATDLFLAVLLVLGVAWLMWVLHLLWAIAPVTGYLTRSAGSGYHAGVSGVGTLSGYSG